MYRADMNSWYLERLMRLVAGLMVLLSVALAVWVNPWWLVLTALVGLNLVVFALTGFCLMANILYALGAREKSLA